MKYSWPILCLCLLQFILASALQVKTCRPAPKVLEEIRRRYRIKLNTAKINMIYDFDKAQIEQLSNGKRVHLGNTTVLIRLTQKIGGENNTQVSKARYETKPITINYETNLEYGKTKVSCYISSSQITFYNPKAPKNNMAMINQLIEYCVDLDICGRIGTFFAPDLIKSESKGINLIKKYEYNPRKTVNAAADFAMAIMMDKIPNVVNGSIKLPDLAKNFSTSLLWTTTGELTATNGSFDGIETIRRIHDLVFENDKLKFSISGTYELGKGILRYSKYHAEYGLIPSIDGKIGAVINNLTVSVNAVFDYNAKPCKIYLEKFDIDVEKFDPEFTGLGFLVNAAVKSMTKLALRTFLLDWVKDNAREQIEQIDCELVRPAAIDLLNTIV